MKAFQAAVMLALVSTALLLSIPGVRASAIEHRDRAFTHAAWDGSIFRMQLLRLVGADVTTNAPGAGPAIVAAGSTGKTEVIRFLLDNGADVNQKDKFGWTALIAAAHAGHLDTVRFLVSIHADLHAVGDGGSALRIAKDSGHPDIAALLEARGAIDHF